jgi:hypothetical protein
VLELEDVELLDELDEVVPNNSNWISHKSTLKHVSTGNSVILVELVLDEDELVVWDVLKELELDVVCEVDELLDELEEEDVVVSSASV